MRKAFFKNILSLLTLLSLCFLSNCELINPTEEIPAFLQVDAFQLKTTESTEGSNSHQITDVWAFINGEALGVFELPATIPVLARGEQRITLFAGIRENGLRSTPVIYPFYSQYEAVLNLQAAQTIALTPSISYLSNNSRFVFLEDFEDSNLELLGVSASDIRQTIEASKVGYGKGTGEIQLTGKESVTLTSVTTFLDLPTTGAVPVYLEMDYRTNVELEVGLLGVDPNSMMLIGTENYKVTLCPIEGWNKVYINFQEDLVLSQLEGYRLAFRATTNNTGCRILGTTPEVLLDNIKLIRFQP